MGHLRKTVFKNIYLLLKLEYEPLFICGMWVVQEGLAGGSGMMALGR